MQTPRPSLNALRAFEAVARLRSMTLAAQELCVTHGAISRQVKALEDTLGLTLLVRSAQSSDPTPEGRRLAGAQFCCIPLTSDDISAAKRSSPSPQPPRM